MNLPLYQEAALDPVVMALKPGANTGLWFTRFFSQFEADWTVSDSGKQNWIKETARQRAGDTDQLGQAAQRIRSLCNARKGSLATLQTTGPFVTGTGLSHPVENGFTFHPVYGVPYLSGASIKGLLRGWIEQWLDEMPCGMAREALVNRWFGAAANKADGGSAGGLIFFDALPTAPVALGCDVMTPHMGDWYEQGASITPAKYAEAAPADWHNPVPIPFLVVKEGASFQFAIAPRNPQNKEDARLALAQLALALEWLGAGAKTAAGYGRMQAASTANTIEIKGETWEGASVLWDKGKRELTISLKGQSVKVTGDAAAAWYGGKLSEELRKRLDKGKDVKVTAVVELKGNQKTLTDIR